MSISGEDKEMSMEKTRSSEPNSGGSTPKSTNPRTSYRECLKNHAANTGGKVTDGCGEFMPGGDEGTLEALKCAACSCHRNFHRKEHHHGEAVSAMVHPLHMAPPLPSPSWSQHRSGAHWVKMAFGGGESLSEEMNFNAFQSNAVAPPPPQKRFRSRFTAEQKEKMLEFAEKVGWRIPREDDAELQRFCGEVGVKRQVFKVWMHNNKSISSKKTPKEFQVN